MVSLGFGFNMLVIFDWFPRFSGCLFSGLVFCLVCLVLTFNSWLLGGHFKIWNTFFLARFVVSLVFSTTGFVGVFLVSVGWGEGGLLSFRILVVVFAPSLRFCWLILAVFPHFPGLGHFSGQFFRVKYSLFQGGLV